MIFRKKIEKLDCLASCKVWETFKSYQRGLLYLIFFLFFVACQEKPTQIKPAFYYWKSNTYISNFEKSYLDSCLTEKLYVRFFDVDWDSDAHFPKPISTIVRIPDYKKAEMIPTVFITNKTFSQLIDNQIDTFAILVLDKIKAINTEGVSFSEIQLDCDWTESTRDKYFSFLNKIKSHSKKKTSATIRLHQIKFKEKTGIPPADRGMLMAYNMGDLDNPTTKNSILDIAILKNYIQNLKSYPLALDIALPIFSWGVVLRDGEVVKLLNNLSLDYFISMDDYGQSEGFKRRGTSFIIEKNMYFKGHYLYKDDEIRLEDTPLSILTETASLLSQNLKRENRAISFFHADSVFLKRYRYEDLQNITRQFN